MTVRINKPALNVREELSKLNKPSGVAGEAMLRAETPQEQFNLIGAGRKNLIINGAMRVSQRGNYSSATGMTSGNYYLDRWKSSHGQTTTIQQTAYDGERTGMKVVVATTNATGYVEQYQVLEDFMIVEGKTVTISAKVKSNAKARLYCSGTNGLEGMSEPHSGNGQEEYMTATFKVSTNNAVLRFYVGFVSATAGSTNVTAGDYFEVTEYQLELGSVATPFEHRSYGEELALCQRYYERYNGSVYPVDVDNPATAHTVHMEYAVTKRAAPTITLGSVSNLDVAYARTDHDQLHGIAITTSHTSSSQGKINSPAWIADAEL